MAEDSNLELQPTLRLWGAQQWGSGSVSHGDPTHRSDFSLRATAPEFSLGGQLQGSSFFAGVEVGVRYFSLTARQPGTGSSALSPSSEFPLEEVDGGAWSVHFRMREGYATDSFGIYGIFPGGSFLVSGPGGTKYASLDVGVGTCFFNQVFLVEFQYSLVGRLESESSEKGEGRLFEIRAGIDLVRLFSSGEAPQPPPPVPPPPPPRPRVQQPPPPPVPPPPPSTPAPEVVRPPEPPRAEIRGQQIVINQRIHFDFDRADIRHDSYPILDAVAEILRSHPEIRRVQIQGHADDVGTDEYNLVLSRRRAENVRTYFTQKGVDPSRLEAAGFGRTRPLAQGTTDEARATNRRTEFFILP